jgi:uncharacterized repeat protein (TIGR01451 family)
LLVGGRFGARVLDGAGNLLRELEPTAGPLEATDVAVDINRQRYVVLYGLAGHVVVYDAQGASLFSFGTTGSGPGEFLSPLAVAVAPTGELIVGDTGHGLVQTFSTSGSFLGAFGGKGSDPGELQQLQGLAVDDAGLIYASDAFQSRVLVFNPAGSLRDVLGTYGDGVGELMTPAGLALSDGRLVVASLNSGSLQVFRLAGAVDGPAAVLQPHSVAFDEQPVGTVSPARGVSLTNGGDLPLVLYHLEVSGPFLETHTCESSIPPGESCTIDISFAPTRPGAQEGSLSIADSAEGSPRRVGLEGRGVVVPVAELAVSKSGGAGPVSPGETVAYTIEVANAGPDVATSVTVIDPLPPALVYEAAAGAGWSCGEIQGTVSCTLPSLPPGSAAPITIQAMVSGSSGFITNTASVSSQVFDSEPDNDTDCAITEVDGVPPVVTRVASIAAMGEGGGLTHAAASTGITQLLITFSEPMNDPAGDRDPDDVTNPSNYLLFAAGGNRLPETVDCANGIDPGDVQVSVEQVLYDGLSTTAILEINGGRPLPRGNYGLLACATTSLVDLVGNPLDGDGDGNGGDDFRFEFRVPSTNLLRNPNFDRDLAFWTLGSPLPTEISHCTDDADRAPTSGSAELVNLTGEGGVYLLSQCVRVEGRQTYTIGGRVRTRSGSMSDPAAVASIAFFSQDDCSGTPLGTESSQMVVGDTATLWSDQLPGSISAPANALSGLVSFAVEAGESSDFVSNIDCVFFNRSTIFSDGFESGDLSIWSSSVSP